MIPLFDRNPSRRLPWVTIGLIVLNFAVFIYMLTLSRVNLDIFTYRYAAVPWEFCMENSCRSRISCNCCRSHRPAFPRASISPL